MIPSDSEVVAALLKIYPEAPTRFVEAIVRFVRHRLQPGGFVTSILENDLRQAIARADATVTLGELRALVFLCTMEIPQPSWGNKSKVALWVHESDSRSLEQSKLWTGETSLESLDL